MVKMLRESRIRVSFVFRCSLRISKFQSMIDTPNFAIYCVRRRRALSCGDQGESKMPWPRSSILFLSPTAMRNCRVWIRSNFCEVSLMASRIEDYAIIGDCQRRRWWPATAPSIGCASRVSIPVLASPRFGHRGARALAPRAGGRDSQTGAAIATAPWFSKRNTNRRRRGRADRLHAAAQRRAGLVRIVVGIRGQVRMRMSSSSGLTTAPSFPGCAERKTASARSPALTR